MILLSARKTQQIVTELPARRDLCDETLRQATLVDFRGSSLSDPGSIPGISTSLIVQQELLDNSF